MNTAMKPRLVNPTVPKSLSIRVREIVEGIRNGSRPTQVINLKQYFKYLGDDVWIVDPETRFQVREELVKQDFVEGRVTYVQNTGDDSMLKPITLLRDDRNASLKILNGNHTAEIRMRLSTTVDPKYWDSPCVIVDYSEFNYNEGYALRFGNKLNDTAFQSNPYLPANVKRELFTRIDLLREEYGLDSDSELPKEALEELKTDFVTEYADISRRSLGQWISNHASEGGRRKPKISYTSEQVEKITKDYIKNKYPEDEYYVYPRGVDGLSGEAWAHGLDVISIERSDYLLNQTGKEPRRKIVILVYATNITQTPDLINGKVKERFLERSKRHKIGYQLDFIYEELPYE